MLLHMTYLLEEVVKTGEGIQVIQGKRKLNFSFPYYRIFPIETNMTI